LAETAWMPRARKLRLPAVYHWPEMAEQGGLIGAGRASPIVSLVVWSTCQNIARTSPADIEQSSRFELVGNLKPAKEIGIEIPANFVLRADKLIE
jgi:putative ABC transport system substrate-binding protein